MIASSLRMLQKLKVGMPKNKHSPSTHQSLTLKRSDISYAMTTEENDIYKMYIYISYIHEPLDETCVIIEILAVLDIECYLKGIGFPPFTRDFCGNKTTLPKPYP